MKNNLVIVGAGGHGCVVADIARRNGYTDIAFLDDDISKTECCGHDVIGAVKAAQLHKNCDFIVAVGNNAIRQKIQQALCGFGLRVITLVHPSAVVADNVEIGIGTVVAAGAIINPKAKIGEGAIVNTSSSVDHDCAVGDFAHISVGAHLAGTVKVGERTLIGAGATVCNDISICADCVIGAGAVVTRTINAPGTYIGVPARKAGERMG